MPDAAAVRAAESFLHCRSDQWPGEITREYKPLVEAARSRVDNCQSCHGDGRSSIPGMPCPICLGLRAALRGVTGEP